MTESKPESLRPQVPTDLEAVEALLELAQAFSPGFQLADFGARKSLGESDSSDEERIRRAEARYQTLVEQIPAVTFMASFENGLSEIYVSPHIETLLGYTAAEWIDNPILWYQRLHPDDKPRWNEEFSRIVSWAEPLKADYRFLAKDGRVVWIHGEARVIRDAFDRPSFVQGIGYDITELKEAEEVLRLSREELEMLVQERTAELAAVNKSLVDAKDEADRANRAKSEFLSRMSHELRTPLNAILGYGQLVEADVTQPDDREGVAQILRAGRHLLGLINEVLDIARIEAGRMEVSLEPVVLDEVIHDAIEFVRPQAAQRQIQLVAVSDEKSYVLADHQRLRQVLLNLLSNAIKYNRDGGRVKVDCVVQSPWEVRVRVTDTGQGLSAEDISKLFTPFERLRAAETRVEGTGLGLSVCQRMVELMGGTIGVESRPGEGSCFWFQLPRANDSTDNVDVLPPARISSADSASGPISIILCIEDNASNVRLLQRVLSRRQKTTFLAAMRGGEGLELARAQKPDLILLDLYLPDMNGDEVLAKLRADEATVAIPVVMVSADATLGQPERLLRAGAQAYVTKPLDVKVLLETVDRTLRDAAAAKDARS
ncbi:MAG TPA: ATP-binding protein [Chthoniobacterales bacterium]|jgi:PAS domain S-box-containing protein